MAELQLTRRSLADQVAEALVDYILDEGLGEGDALPSTADLSERFGVSRTVVREALAALAGRGVLTRSQGRESVVATPGASDLKRLLQFRVNDSDITEFNILDTRVALEVLGARLAATHATADDHAEMRARLHELATAKTDAAYHRADLALHRAILVGARNPLLVLISDALVDFLRKVRVAATQARRARGESLEPVIEQHRVIIEAIEAGDADAAAATMQSHLTATRSELA